MKFQITRSKFLDGLKAVQNIVAGKGSLPILQNVLMSVKGNELTLTTTDLDISIKSTVDCEGIEEGSTTLPVKLLVNSISKVVEGVVEVTVDEQNKSSIVAGSTKFKLAGLPADDFPVPPKDEETFSYRVEQATFKEMLRKTAYAASQDETRRTLKGVLLSFKDKMLTMVATDGRRLAMVDSEVEFPKDAEKDIVLPFKAVQELQRSLGTSDEVTITVEKTQISFKLGSIAIFSKLMEGAYPNYQQVIPKESSILIEVDRQLLFDALERASVMTMDEAHSTKLIFSTNKLTVTSAASEIGEAKDEVPIKYVGEKVEIMFNPTYVMDPLKAIDDDEVVIKLNNGHSPAVITCKETHFLYVLMPLRTN